MLFRKKEPNGFGHFSCNISYASLIRARYRVSCALSLFLYPIRRQNMGPMPNSQSAHLAKPCRNYALSCHLCDNLLLYWYNGRLIPCQSIDIGSLFNFPSSINYQHPAKTFALIKYYIRTIRKRFW